MTDCLHENFNLRGDVSRILKNEGDIKPGAFMVEIKIHCRDCGLPFEFVGFEMGCDYNKPLVSVDHLELRAPITPKGDIRSENPFGEFSGFRVRQLV